MHPRKRTVGVRVPEHTVAQALLAELGEPLVSSTLLLPGQDEPMTQGWEIKERLDHLLDAVVDAGDCGTEPTTVVDLSAARAGDPAPGGRRPVPLRVDPSRRRGGRARPVVDTRAGALVSTTL